MFYIFIGSAYTGTRMRGPSRTSTLKSPLPETKKEITVIDENAYKYQSNDSYDFYQVLTGKMKSRLVLY